MSCAIECGSTLPATSQFLSIASLKVPEDWEREYNEGTTLKTALSGLLIVLIAAVVLHGLWLLVRRVRDEA